MQNIYGQEIEVPGVSLKDAIEGTEAFARLCRDTGVSIQDIATARLCDYCPWGDDDEDFPCPVCGG